MENVKPKLVLEIPKKNFKNYYSIISPNFQFIRQIDFGIREKLC